MSANDFEIGSMKFKLSKIDAFKQFHIVKRIAPILSEMLPAMKEIQKVGKGNPELSETEKLEQFAAIASPIMLGISKLSDSDADKVLFGLLESVQMQQESGGWAKVASSGVVMIQNLELPVLLQLAGRAFAYNLSGFFQGLPVK